MVGHRRYVDFYRKLSKVYRGGRQLKYDEFFRAFHIGENDGYLIGITTTWAIPKFFAETIVATEKYREKLPSDDMSYDKWYQGNSSPRNHWLNMAKDYNEETLVNALKDKLDDANLEGLLKKFGCTFDAGNKNKELLCLAIAQQFKAIIDGKGEATDIIGSIYNSGNLQADFMEYVEKASQRYNTMKLIGGDEVPLEDFFVCNTIGEKERVFADKQRLKCTYLDNPNLLAIRKLYEKRKYDNLRTILIGSGGCGKSLLLQHMFLDAAKEYPKTGTLPIFIELRYFKQGDDLENFIVESVSSRDRKFDSDIAKGLFLSGRCQLLLDGFDEIDPSDVNVFLKKLEKFSCKYEKVQIVITSRDSEYITGLHGYIKLYVWPFDSEQSMRLIEKILKYYGNPEEKETVIDYISNGFLQKDGVFASHPLLLTFVTMNYPTYKRFNDNHLLFYKHTYETLLSGHDDNKKPYDRVFLCVDNAEQFSKIFMQFCAYTYRDGKLQLSTADFEAYFDMLTAQKEFENPHKVNIKSFKHDVCSTACIMYEKAYDLYYIDPGFQEYLFAEYYKKADESEINELLNSLYKLPYESLLRYEALDMLHGFAEEKFNFRIIKPFLDSIYKGDDEHDFMLFIEKCFNEVSIANINPLIEGSFAKKLNAQMILQPPVESYPRTILLNYVLRAMGEQCDSGFYLRARFMNSYPADVVCEGKLIGQENGIDGEPVLLIDYKPKEVYELFNSQSQSGKDCGFFVGEDKKLIDFGDKIVVDSYYLNTEPETYAELIRNVASNSSETYNAFKRLKEYHKQLKRDYHHSGLS